MSKNDRIEVKCSKQTKDDFADLVAGLTPILRRKLQRRVVSEDVIMLILKVYQNYEWIFNEIIQGKPQFK